MHTFRHKQRWLLWIVGLALVFTGTLSPAQALACAAGATQLQTAQSGGQSKRCVGMEQQASCCCKPGAKLSAAHHHPVGTALTTAGCGCSVQAPDTAPAPATKGAALLLSPEAALLPAFTLEIELLRAQSWAFAAPSTGPPPAPLRSTGPSRAPPAL